ncbi:hypothetical protein V5799_033562 [Amblyomma americanum]|uniref:M13 family peptidase n=1 Tax=Amblyomma americanum TaxID=6943 RepID=A0AAQ4DMZ0_AMBAM
MALLIAIAILLPLLAVALAWYFLSPLPSDKHVAVCLTVDCRHFGREISTAINHAADPCEDFHSFVCGAWDDPKRQETTEARMMSAAAELALKEIEADTTQLSKATQFYQSCIRANEHKKENLKDFSEMRSFLGLFWPEQQSQNVHPLDVMVNLAINWDMNFLFDLSTIDMRNSTALLISRGPLDNGWELSIRKRRSLERYRLYLEQHLEILGVSDALMNMSAADLLGLETAILDAKLGFLYDAPVQEWFSLGAMGTKTPAHPADLWLSFLAKHDREFTWTAESIVIAEDVKILENLEKLLKSLSHDKLIIGLSWMFIQTHLWAVYGDPSIRFHGLSDDLNTLKHHGCVAYVESRLGLLSVWKTMNERFGFAANRLHIFSFLHRVNENAKRLINGLTWMDERSKRTAFLKLDKMTRVILPGGRFFTREQTEELYSVFPDMNGKTFMENLLNASKIYRELRSHDHFADVYSVRMFSRLGRESYLYLPNIMYLAFGDLEAPVFYNNATLAIRYGGLGSFAARQIVKAFDDVGVTVDEEGNSGLWLGPAPATVHSEKSRCDVRARSGSPGSRPLRFFPVIPGLEIAFQGYVSAVDRDYRGLEDFKVAHLEAFTDDQIFFLAYCYTMCAKRRQTGGDEYSALGSFAARQIVKAFDEVGITADEEGNSGLITITYNFTLDAWGSLIHCEERDIGCDEP